MKSLLTILLYVAANQTFGQELNVIGASGAQTKTGTYEVNYTIGETIVNTANLGNNGTITQGFHQSYITVNAIDKITASYDLHIFPNPTQKQIVIESNHLDQIQTFRIFDSKGALVDEIQNTEIERTQIDLQEMRAGKYFLKAIHKDNTSVLTYQIIKSH